MNREGAKKCKEKDPQIAQNFADVECREFFCGKLRNLRIDPSSAFLFLRVFASSR
jgi:hypothetical protein